MHLYLQRIHQKALATVGILTIDTGALECYTLEDGYRRFKTPGESRIPPGTYELALRCEGGMHVDYCGRYDWHAGMLWVRNVPFFEWIYLHVGNTADNTRGCILLGDAITSRPVLERSAQAYQRVYTRVRTELERGERVLLTVIDEPDGLEREYYREQGAS